MSFIHSDQDPYQKHLQPERYAIMRQGATEPPFLGQYYDFNKEGLYLCGLCHQILFRSNDKYNSQSGWPSFCRSIDQAVFLKEDFSFGMKRIEVLCSRCKSHLGHLFDDAPRYLGRQRFCINSLALDFQSFSDKI